MKTQLLGRSKLKSTRLSYGCMRISGTWDPKAVTPELEKAGIKAVLTAFECGYTLFDHADIYGRGTCESIFGKALKQHKALRKAVIATKCGIRFRDEPPGTPHRYDFSAEHILWSCDQSLKRLGVDRIDLYQLHRPDLLADPGEIAKAFSKLKKQGKVREFGVSNFLPPLLSAIQKACPMPLIVNQVEIHPARLDCFTDGTLDQCLELGITPLAWSPLGGGLFGEGGHPPKDHPQLHHLNKLCATLDAMANGKGVSRAVLTLSWLLKHPSGIIPIVGTANPARIKDMAKADDLELTREEWYEILLAARGKPLP